MALYYDRKGEPISLMEWASTPHDREHRCVDYHLLPDGREVSTVWLGLDHRYDESRGSPLIFETMVFPHVNSALDLHCERYSTEEQAREGHSRILAECAEGKHNYKRDETGLPTHAYEVQ